MFFRRSAALLVLATFAAAGCGSDDNGVADPDDDITQTEALTVFSELMTAAFLALSSPQADLGTTGASDPVTWSATAPCELGGEVSATVTYEDFTNGTGTGDIFYEVIQTPNACKVNTTRGQYTVSGSPNLRWAVDYSVTEWQPSQNWLMEFVGGYSFTGPVSGTCQVDMTYDFNYTEGTGTVAGTICGYSVNQQF
jgi:hypothetical protein